MERKRNSAQVKRETRRRLQIDATLYDANRFHTEIYPPCTLFVPAAPILGVSEVPPFTICCYRCISHGGKRDIKKKRGRRMMQSTKNNRHRHRPLKKLNRQEA